MKRLVLVVMLALAGMLVMPTAMEAKVAREPGGVPAFIVGCCWGIREGTEWNEGADMHWREWLRIVPYVGIVFAVWDGVDSYSGITAHQWAEKNGANWY